MSTQPRRAVALMVSASFFFSLMNALAKLAAQHLPVSEVVFARSALMLVFVLPTIVRRRIDPRGVNRFGLLVRSASGSISLGLSFTVMALVPIADASLLNQSTVFWVPFVSAALLGERLSRTVLFLTGVAFLGCLLIIKPSFHISAYAGFLGLGAGLFSALAYVTMRRLHKTDVDVVIVLHFATVGTIGALVVGYPHFQWPSFREALILLGVGTSGTIGQIYLTRAFRYAEASVVSPFIFAIVLFSLIWGVLFWGEFPDLLSLIGMAIAVISGIMLTRASARLSVA